MLISCVLLSVISVSVAQGQSVDCPSNAAQNPAAKGSVGVPESTTAQANPEKSRKPPFSLRLTHENIVGVSIEGKDAKLAEVTAELSRQLKIPVHLSSVMANQSVTVNFRDLVLEAAMQMLAPEVYIDYELSSTPGVSPKPLGIFLQAHNELPPPANAVVQAKSQIVVISGNTEDDPSTENEDEDVRVFFERGNLTVKAKQQLLVEVLSRVAEELAIPFDGEQDSRETVSVNIVKTPVEDAILRIAPNIRLFVRADLLRAFRTPLRISLVAGREGRRIDSPTPTTSLSAVSLDPRDKHGTNY